MVRVATAQRRRHADHRPRAGTPSRMVGDRAWHAWRQHERCHRTTGCRPGLSAHPADRPGALFAAAVRLSMAGGPELDFDLVVIRSEEHTSELQSLMRTSYAVFCFNKTTHH